MQAQGMLPAWVQSFDHHTLTATFEHGSDGLRIEIAGGQDVGVGLRRFLSVPGFKVVWKGK